MEHSTPCFLGPSLPYYHTRHTDGKRSQGPEFSRITMFGSTPLTPISISSEQAGLVPMHSLCSHFSGTQRSLILGTETLCLCAFLQQVPKTQSSRRGPLTGTQLVNAQPSSSQLQWTSLKHILQSPKDSAPAIGASVAQGGSCLSAHPILATFPSSFHLPNSLLVLLGITS